MNDTLKKFLQFGVGSFYILRDKTNKAVAGLRKEGVFDEGESKKVVKEAVGKAQVGFNKTAVTVKEKISEIRSKAEQKAAEKTSKDQESSTTSV